MVRIQKQRSEKGMSLATVLIIGMVCTLWITGIFASILPTLGQARNGRMKAALRGASEAALDWAVSDLSNGNTSGIDSKTYGQTTTSTVPTNIVTVTDGYAITATVQVTNKMPQYQGSPSFIANNNSESFLYNQQLDKDVNGNGGVNKWRVVTATATGPSGRRAAVRCVLMPLTQNNPPPPNWNWGPLAVGTSFTQNGKNATVDYYDSAVNVSPATFKTASDPNDADTSIGITGKGGSTATFNGGGVIGGNLNTTGGTTVSGSPTTNGNDPNFPGNQFPQVAASNMYPFLNNNNPIAGAFTINPGNYQYTSNSTAITQGPITIPATATAANPVRIFIDSAAATAISLNGKNGVFNNLSGVPGALQIYIKGTSAVSIGGNGDFRGVIYAPNANVSISGTGAVYGAIVGNNVTMNGSVSGFHYDQQLASLNNLPFPPSTSVLDRRTVVSWQEVE